MIYYDEDARIGLIRTKKSSLYFMFLKSPPTMAARWITCVGWCRWNRALVAAISLQINFLMTVSSINLNTSLRVPALSQRGVYFLNIRGSGSLI